MSDSIKEKRRRVRATVSLVASILIGLTFLISGSGKVFGYGEMPGQTMQFIGSILPDAWLTPQLALFMGDIFFPYIIPWTELCLGILLLLRIWPRLFAAITLPLTAAFMANNAWYISQGQTKFTSCECFGIWEKLFGTLTHVQSLSLDIILFALALTIVLVHPGDFLSSPPWLDKIQKGTKRQKNRGCTMRQFRLNILSPQNHAGLVMLLTTTVLLLSSACTPPTPPPPPPPPNQPPVIDSITAEEEILTLAETQIICQASDADSDNLTYQWSVDGGTITGEGSTVTWAAPDTSDNYTITVTVSDGKGGTIAQSTTIAAIYKPNEPPVVTGLTIDGAPPAKENTSRAWVTKTIHCNAQDPDGDNLSYLWRTTGGKITGEGSTVGWTSPGINGDYSITVVVSDGRDGKAEGSVVFKVLCCGRG